MSLFPVTGQSSGYPVYTTGSQAGNVTTIAGAAADTAISTELAGGGDIANAISEAVDTARQYAEQLMFNHVRDYH